MVSQHHGQLFSAETRAFAVSREIDRIADMNHRSAGGHSPIRAGRGASVVLAVPRLFKGVRFLEKRYALVPSFKESDPLAQPLLRCLTPGVRPSDLL
jgi:hypothetical protein